MLTDCLFADGSTPLAASYQQLQVSNNFDVTVNTPKAKHMVTDLLRKVIKTKSV